MRASVLLFAVMLAACSLSPPEGAVTVEQVRKNIFLWDGKNVQVSGWLGECGGLDCGLYQTLEDAKLVSAGDYHSDAWKAAMRRRLSIGYDENFDLVAGFFQFQRVIVTGRVNSLCSRPDIGCTDRADDIRPISIKKLL